jgi:hypothetical protein
MKDPQRRKLTVMLDHEKLNLLSPEGCAACGGTFTLGETVVLACGPWEGAKFVHEAEAVWDEATSAFVERRCYRSRTPASEI